MRVSPIGPNVLRLELDPDARHLTDALGMHKVSLGGNDKARVIPAGEANHLNEWTMTITPPSRKRGGIEVPNNLCSQPPPDPQS